MNPKKCCGNCAYYMSDEDECGNVTDFHHDRNKDEGFCAIRDLFYTVKNYEKACTDWVHDGLTPQSTYPDAEHTTQSVAE